MPKVQKLRKYKLRNEITPYEVPIREEEEVIVSTPPTSTSIVIEKGIENQKKEIKIKILSRGQRKRQEKRDHILTKLGVLPLKGMKISSSISSSLSNNNNNTNKENNSKKGKQKNFNSLLSELEATLPIENLNEVVRPAALPNKSNKIKKSIAIREIQRMKLVEEHPSFKSNPLLAMKTHIEQMIALKTQERMSKK